MEDVNPADKPYILLGNITREAMTQELGGAKADDAPATPELVADRIRIMYYSALTNLYVQSVLPGNIKAIGGDMPPRLEVTLKRSYQDFTAAGEWLSKQGELINVSPAKQLYNEVSDMSKNVITGDASAYLNS